MQLSTSILINKNVITKQNYITLYESGLYFVLLYEINANLLLLLTLTDLVKRSKPILGSNLPVAGTIWLIKSALCRSK